MINRPQDYAAIKHLIPVACGWAVAAILEAACYIQLALAIIEQQSPQIVLFIAAITILTTIQASRSGFWAGARLANALYSALGATMQQAKLSWFTPSIRTLLIETVSRSIPGFMSIPAHQFQVFIHAPLIPLYITFGIGLIGGIPLVMMLASLLLISFVIQSMAQRALARADMDRNNAELATNQSTLELIDHVELLRTAAGYNRATERLEQNWQAQEIALGRTNRAAAIATLLSAIASFLPIAGMAVYLVLSGVNNTTMLLAVLMLTMRASAPLETLAVAAISINDQLAAIKHYRQATNAPTLKEPSQAQQKTPHNHTIELNNVTFPPAVQNINATIEPGERVLICGPSGSGKTSLLKLLMRFDDPTLGLITLGKVPLTSVPAAELARFFAYVPQDPLIFTGTIASNIRIGNPDADDQAVDKAARQMALDEVLDRSELGIYQEVGLQGAGLSGGERQRLALARALIKNAPILIMDEATSALDEETEKRVAKAICEQSCTLVLVSHRNQSLWQPTKIIEFHQSVASK
ncbi:ABC transporter ATP-binding protein [Shewanella oncorhynchi]|uniref:ABC transporter ATP-binding protein n=1 Tax=Shewanella oncorhynchi TaxID=2726434 RepID=UPI003D7ADC08